MRFLTSLLFVCFLITKVKMFSLRTTQDDSVLNGEWEYHDELYEKPGLWACPHVAEDFESPRHWWKHIPLANYIPPPGKRILNASESVDIIKGALNIEEKATLEILFIGDSLSRQKFFASMCYAETANLTIKSHHIHSRFLTQNPCGCFPENHTDNHYINKAYQRCEKEDPPWNWPSYPGLHIAAYSGGAWFTPHWLGCLDNDQIEAAHEKALMDLVPTLRKQMEEGIIVLWYTLPYSLSTNPAYAHHTFKSRNAVARRILVPEGVIFIDPFELLKTRIFHDATVKCDDLHFCGFGPRSPTVFEVQLILHFVAKALQ